MTWKSALVQSVNFFCMQMIVLFCFRTKTRKLYLGNWALNCNLVVNGMSIISYHSILVKPECIWFGSRRKFRKVQNFGIECNSVKYLGVILDNFLSGEAIENSIIHKVNSKLKFLNRQCSSLNEKKSKVTVFCIDRHLVYSCSSWYAGLNKTWKKKLYWISQN